MAIKEIVHRILVKKKVKIKNFELGQGLVRQKLYQKKEKSTENV